MKRTLLFATAFATAWFVSSALAETGNELFQKALVKERSEGNLKEAIKLYQQVVDKYGKDRALAARALMAIGESQEKLGEAEARKTYERIVKEFADQRGSVEQASQRLAGLGTGRASGGIRLSQFFKPDKPDVTLWNFSADGRWAGATDYDTGNAAVVNLSTGITQNVTDYGNWNNEKGFVDQGAISRDGKQMAFWHYKNNATQMSLRVVNVQSKTERTLYRAKGANGEEEWGIPTDWSPDGTQIVMQIETRFGKTLQEGVTEFVMVPAAGGEPRVIKRAEYTRRYRIRILFSPDGKYLAYDFPARKELAQGDIFVVPVSGGPETVIAPSSAQDTIVGWTPDGGSLLFVSERTPGTGLYRVAVREGKQAGEPELIRRDIGNALPLALTRSGAFYHVQQPSVMNAYVASLDFSTGKLLSPLTRITESVVDSISSPAWSADGRMIAMLKWPGPRPSILIRPDGPGAERELVANLQIAGAPLVWSPDGRSIMANGTKNDKSGLYRIDAVTGEAQLIREGAASAWSPDGRFVWRVTRPASLVRIDTATGEENTIFTGPPEDALRNVRLSADNRWMTFTQGSKRLFVIPTDGGSARELPAFGGEGNPGIPAWTPDGRNLVVPYGKDGRFELWIVPTDGSPTRKADVGALDLPGVISVHPDGKRISWSTRVVKYEYWALEDFLPAAKTSR